MKINLPPSSSQKTKGIQMRINQTKLLATAAVMALALGTVSKVQAFDGVDWNWDKTVTSTENIIITVNDIFDWSGLVEIEKIQANIGDVTATSTVSHIDNNAPGVIRELEIFARQGVDLPELVSAATAVANNQSIESASAVNLHDAQFNFGSFNTVDTSTEGQGPNLSDLYLVGLADQTDNAHTDAALGLLIAGALGIITPGEVTATSTVSDILNASVDSAATAVGNNLSLALEAATAGDATVIADLTQFNYADVSATSTVADVDIENYANLGDAGFGPCGGCVIDGNLHDGPQTALISSLATAVGNNVSIKVNGPATAPVVVVEGPN